MSKALAFRDRDETLRIYNSGEALVKQLTAVSPLCASIGTDIKIDAKPIAEGHYGSVSDVIFPGAKKGQYVIKSFFDTDLETLRVKPPQSLEKIVKEQKDYDPHLLMDLNVSPRGPTAIVENIVMPKFALQCSPKKKYKIKSNVSKKSTTLTKPYYLCPTGSIPEYVLSLLVANLYRDGTCVHFIDTVDLLTCVEAGSPKQYTIMEKVDNTLLKIIECALHEEMVACLLIQILFAVACYQHRYQISHNDLHYNNVLIKYVTPDTEWNGQKLADASYHHYHILGTDLYIPAIPVLVKIADFGLGVKWSPPVIGDEYYATVSDYIPHEFVPQYDSLYITFIIRRVSKTPSFFVRTVQKASIGDGTIAYIDNITSDGTRPSVTHVGKYADAAAVKLLTNTTLMAAYTQKPAAGKIVTLGRLT